MDSTNTTSHHFENGRREIPGMLNVLTILTFIGCAYVYLTTIYGFFTSGKDMEKLEEMRDEAGEGGGFLKMMAEGSYDIAVVSDENKYILLVAGLLFTTMCLIGAIQMRKLKRSGYLIYVIGEIAPVVLSAVLFYSIPFGQVFTGFAAFIALIFVILYTTQRKHLAD